MMSVREREKEKERERERERERSKVFFPLETHLFYETIKVR